MVNGKRSLWILHSFILAFMLLTVLLGSRTVTTIAEQLPIDRSVCFIVDAGHGGVDGGATSCTGKLESSFNLEIALRINDLMHFLGYQTKMIRTTDISVYTAGEIIAQKKISDLRERVRICNETEDAILLSIHQNTFSDERYSGPQVFYGSTAGSDTLAKQLQSAMIAALCPGSNRKSKQAKGVYLMEHIQCTGVLIECGFLSNPEEEARLRDPAYQKKLSCVICSVAVSYANT